MSDETLGGAGRLSDLRRFISISFPEVGGEVGHSVVSRASRPVVEVRKNPGKSLVNWWWAEQGSNLRPQPCKGRALPTELSARV
jgi:hypothetical protein